MRYVSALSMAFCSLKSFLAHPWKSVDRCRKKIKKSSQKNTRCRLFFKYCVFGLFLISCKPWYCPRISKSVKYPVRCIFSKLYQAKWQFFGTVVFISSLIMHFYRPLNCEPYSSLDSAPLLKLVRQQFLKSVP